MTVEDLCRSRARYSGGGEGAAFHTRWGMLDPGLDIRSEHRDYGELVTSGLNRVEINPMKLSHPKCTY